MAEWPKDNDNLSVPELVEIIGDGNEGHDVRSRAASLELNSRLKRLSTAELFQAIFEGEIDDAYPWMAIRVLHARATPEVFEAAVACAESDDPCRRIRGFNVLSQLGIKYGSSENPFRDRCVELAIRGLQDPDSDVVAAAAWVLNHHESEHGKATLMQLKDHPSEDVRLAVATAACPDENETELRVALELMEDSDEDVRDWATFALGTQCELDSPEIRDALRARLNDPHKDTRNEALWGLVHRRDISAIRTLLQRLGAEAWVKGDEYAAERALNITGDVSVEHLCEGLRKLVD